MSDLSIEDFASFFKAVHKREPYPGQIRPSGATSPGGTPEPKETDPYDWQTRLAERAIGGNWPKAIDLPTGSGKTACIDIAVFALACQANREPSERDAPRRVFFCVNRRVIVDEAHQRARRIAGKLWEAERAGDDSPILRKVAKALRDLAGTTIGDGSPPLDVLELRGGIYRDNRWARSVAQPTVVCTTIDQLGSRLLFRGYGVSPNAAPIQAALVAYDSLILLDEAHISRPFSQTLKRVHDYLDPTRWAEQPIGARPMTVVPMTATPPDDLDDVIRLSDQDRENESLAARLRAAKPATLEKVSDVSKAILERAEELAKSGPLAIGIIVNRVATAKEIYKKLRDHDAHAELVIGAMRPIDRDGQSEILAELVGKRRPDTTLRASFIVATQCLEVGADYDFDALLTECASLDALRQRFGRLNRAGRAIEARAAIFIKDKDVKPEEDLADDDPRDPIYGNALARTWNWLWDHAEATALPADDTKAGKGGKGKAKATESRTIDFGINALKRLISDPDGKESVPRNLLAPSALLDAPVMLPAYPDFWCQTSPSPALEPDVALFIHGQKGTEPDVQVCWRADLVEDEVTGTKHWPDVVALLPPTAAECMSVPISRVQRWLAGARDDKGMSDTGDVLGIASKADDDTTGPDRGRSKGSCRKAVLWRGSEKKKSRPVSSPRDLRPGDTLVLPATEGGWDELGHVGGRAIDRAEDAFERARDKFVLRLHPSLFPSPTGPIKAILDRISDRDERLGVAELRALLGGAAKAESDLDSHTKRKLRLFSKDRRNVPKLYPERHGIVFTSSKRTVRRGEPTPLPPLDDGEDQTSRLGEGKPVSLKNHTAHVREAVDRVSKLIHVRIDPSPFPIAAERHDWGKADDRFQAMLRGTSRTDAWLSQGETPELLAKSVDGPNASWRTADSGLRGFRHEMLSVQIAKRVEIPDDLVAESDLIFHLIESHHGYARPFAPFFPDGEPPDVTFGDLTIKSDERRKSPAHRFDSGVADRFWTLTRRFGWWGLAYLEAILRLADQHASAGEAAGIYSDQATKKSAETNL